MTTGKKIKRRKKRFYYISSVLSISLVLYLSGLFGFVMLNVNALVQTFQENFQVHVLFMDEAREADIRRLTSEWENSPGINSAVFIHKEAAKDEIIEELGEDFVEFLGYNPLPHTVELYLHADYVNVDSLNVIKTEIMRANHVKEVLYHELAVENLEQNVQIAGSILLGLAGIFLLITIALINSTIRLSMFSKRFLIKSMQLVGATKGFIQKPFLLTALYHGFLAGLIALGLLAGTIYYLYTEEPRFVLTTDPKLLSILAAGLITGGIIIALISSYFAVNKYLKIKLDQLY